MLTTIICLVLYLAGVFTTPVLLGRFTKPYRDSFWRWTNAKEWALWVIFCWPVGIPVMAIIYAGKNLSSSFNNLFSYLFNIYNGEKPKPEPQLPPMREAPYRETARQKMK